MLGQFLLLSFYFSSGISPHPGTVEPQSCEACELHLHPPQKWNDQVECAWAVLERITASFTFLHRIARSAWGRSETCSRAPRCWFIKNQFAAGSLELSSYTSQAQENEDFTHTSKSRSPRSTAFGTHLHTNVHFKCSYIPRSKHSTLR